MVFFFNFNRVMPGNEMVIFFYFFFCGGGRVWHFSATYNVVLLNDLHKHAPSINYFSHIFS